MATKKKAAKKSAKKATKKKSAKKSKSKISIVGAVKQILRFNPDWIIDKGPQLGLSAAARREVELLRREMADRLSTIIKGG